MSHVCTFTDICMLAGKGPGVAVVVRLQIPSQDERRAALKSVGGPEGNIDPCTIDSIFVMKECMIETRQKSGIRYNGKRDPPSWSRDTLHSQMPLP